MLSSRAPPTEAGSAFEYGKQTTETLYSWARAGYYRESQPQNQQNQLQQPQSQPQPQPQPQPQQKQQQLLQSKQNNFDYTGRDNTSVGDKRKFIFLDGKASAVARSNTVVPIVTNSSTIPLPQALKITNKYIDVNARFSHQAPYQRPQAEARWKRLNVVYLVYLQGQRNNGQVLEDFRRKFDANFRFSTVKIQQLLDRLIDPLETRFPVEKVRHFFSRLCIRFSLFTDLLFANMCR